MKISRQHNTSLLRTKSILLTIIDLVWLQIFGLIEERKKICCFFLLMRSIPLSIFLRLLNFNYHMCNLKLLSLIDRIIAKKDLEKLIEISRSQETKKIQQKNGIPSPLWEIFH